MSYTSHLLYLLFIEIKIYLFLLISILKPAKEQYCCCNYWTYSLYWIYYIIVYLISLLGISTTFTLFPYRRLRLNSSFCRDDKYLFYVERFSIHPPPPLYHNSYSKRKKMYVILLNDGKMSISIVQLYFFYYFMCEGHICICVCMCVLNEIFIGSTS